MPTLVTKTIQASGGDYTSFSAWESGQQADLVAADQIQRVECYGIADTAAAQHIDGWTTDATRYIEVATVGADRASPAWSTGKYRLTGSNFALIIDEDYVRLDGLQLAATGGTSVVNTTGAGEVRISNCYLDGANESVGPGSSTGGVLKIWNCILSAGATSYCLHATGTNCTTYIYNCTCVNGNVAVFCENAGATIVAKNVIGSRNTGVQFLRSSGTMTCTNCASADATADDNGGSGNRVSQTFSFVSGTDYALASSDTGAKDFGADLSADADLAFSTDINGTTRSAPWDIGAYEAAAAGLAPVGFGGTKAHLGAKGPRDRRGFLLQRIWDYTIVSAGDLVFNATAAIQTWVVPASLLAAVATLAATPSIQAWVVPGATLTTDRTLAATPSVQTWTVPAASLSASDVALAATPVVQTWVVPAPALTAAATLAATPAILTWTVPASTLFVSGGSVTFNATPAIQAWTVPAALLLADRALIASSAVQTWTVQTAVVMAARAMAGTASVQTWAVPSAVLFVAPSVAFNATPAVQTWVVPGGTVSGITVTFTFRIIGDPVMTASVVASGILVGTITGEPA